MPIASAIRQVDNSYYEWRQRAGRMEEEFVYGLDGYEFIRSVRRLPEGSGGKTPAIALTAFARSEDRSRAMVAGYQMHIAKAIEPYELLATVFGL